VKICSFALSVVTTLWAMGMTFNPQLACHSASEIPEYSFLWGDHFDPRSKIQTQNCFN